MTKEEAFETLLTIARLELEKAKREGAALFTTGDITRVRDIASLAEKIQTILFELHNLQQHWCDLTLQQEPVVFSHQIREVIIHTPSGKKTPQKKYRISILQTLFEMGGSGQAKIVIDRVGEKMKDVLNDYDKKPLKSRGEIRWRNTVAWTRNDLLRRGILIIEIPESGKYPKKAEGICWSTSRLLLQDRCFPASVIPKFYEIINNPYLSPIFREKARCQSPPVYTPRCKPNKNLL